MGVLSCVPVLSVWLLVVLLMMVVLLMCLLTDGTAVPAVVLLHLTPAGLHQHPAVTVTLTLLPRSASPPSLSSSVMSILTGLSVPG